LEIKILHYRSLNRGKLDEYSPFVLDMKESVQREQSELDSMLLARIHNGVSYFLPFREDIRIISQRKRCEHCFCLLSFAGFLHCYRCRALGLNKKKRKRSFFVESDPSTLNALLGDDIVPTSSTYVKDLTVDGNVELNPGPCSFCFRDDNTVINGMCGTCYSWFSTRSKRNKQRNPVQEKIDLAVFIKEKELGRRLTYAEKTLLVERIDFNFD